LLGGAAVAIYAAARAAADALTSLDHPAPARRATVHAAMTAIISLAAIVQRPALLDIGVGVPFAASIAALTLALGVVLFVAPPQKRNANPAAHPTPHRAWAFLLPTGLLLLLIGFTGELTARSALILAAEGGAILIVSSGPRTRSSLAGAEQSAHVPARFVLVQTTLALALAMIAAWAMMRGASELALHSPLFRPGVAAVLVLGPAVVLPMIPPIATLAESGKRDEAQSTVVAFALINLCVVLPLVIFVQLLIEKSSATTQPSAIAGLPFPILTWRLDTVLLATVGLLLLPTAIGRWTLGRVEGIALIGLYVVYLFLTLLISHN
jgi:Ca2+/Na+ antiporter